MPRELRAIIPGVRAALLAMTLAHGGVPRSAAWAQLSRVPDLRGISRAEFDTVTTRWSTW